jgi:uncharacterized protein (DUF433 family)
LRVTIKALECCPHWICRILKPALCFIHYELAGLHLNYPGVRSGKPCVKGTRITVPDVLEYLASGMNEQAILADFPELRREHIQAVLGFAAERERRLSALPAVS